MFSGKEKEENKREIINDPSEIKGSTTLIHMVTWMTLQTDMLSEKNLTSKDHLWYHSIYITLKMITLQDGEQSNSCQVLNIGSVR